MARKPLPSDVHFTIRSDDEIRRLMARNGVPRHATANLSLDQLHAMLTEHVVDKDLARLLVIVSEKSGAEINKAMIYAASRLRKIPRRFFDRLLSRARAIEELGISSLGLSIEDMEAVFKQRNDDVVVILKNEDYAKVRGAINEIVSGLPHGRAPEFD